MVINTIKNSFSVSGSSKYNKEFKLITLGIDQMPPYIKNNQTKYKDWLDFN